jgi:putative transposase
MEPAFPTDEESLEGTRDWPHAPPHRLAGAGVYFLTARCLNQVHHFATPERRDFLQERLLTLAQRYGWRMEAWAVLSNHYHFVAHCGGNAEAASLSPYMRHLHGDTARHVNKLDGMVGRKLWHNFRDTHLTYQHSYLARLNYTHQNPVHHGLVPVANQWPWCSAAKFEQSVTPAWRETILSFKFDQIAKDDGE